MFITIEGLDASGKTTLVNNVTDILKQQGYNVNIISKNSLNYELKSYVGNRLKYLNEILFRSNPNDNLTDIPVDAWVLLNASWFSIVSHNYIVKDEINISDSWIYKRIARFSLLSEFKSDDVEKLYKRVIKPDLTFFLNTPPEETWKRRDKHSRKDFGFLVMDNEKCTKKQYLEYQSNIYDKLYEYSKKYKWIVLDGSKSELELKNEVLKFIV